MLASADPKQLQELLPLLAGIPTDKLAGLLQALASVPTASLKALVSSARMHAGCRAVVLRLSQGASFYTAAV